MRVLRFLSILLLSLVLPLGAQEEKPVSIPAPPTESEKALNILSHLHGEIKNLKAPAKLQEQEAGETKEALERLKSSFNELLAGKDSTTHYNENPAETSLQEELVEIFNPLIGEVKSATSKSREKDALRNQILLLEERKKAINSALDRIQAIIKLAEVKDTTKELRRELKDREKTWLARQEQAMLEHETALLQLDQMLQESPNAVESASKVVAKFFKTRGFHLIIGIASAFLVLLLTRLLYKHLIIKISPFHRKEHLIGTSKTIDGLVHIASSFLALIALLLAFFLCDDWVLLSASLLIFVGIFWALRDKLSSLIEEFRLILNIGSAREGERIVYNGLPWKIEKIRVYSRLTNHELEGGFIRIPVNALVGHLSRPCTVNDRYFPTSANDWVILSDKTFGKVLRQTPEYVELIQLGGSRKTYRTLDFLALAPENLSHTQFRISSFFGIDYKHQKIATSEAAEELKTRIKAGLIEVLDHKDSLKRLNVEFANAGASSLDFEIQADFASSSAPKYNILNRRIQRLAVETCNELGWVIPFTQITVHQAGEATES